MAPTTRSGVNSVDTNKGVGLEEVLKAVQELSARIDDIEKTVVGQKQLASLVATM